MTKGQKTDWIREEPAEDWEDNCLDAEADLTLLDGNNCIFDSTRREILINTSNNVSLILSR